MSIFLFSKKRYDYTLFFVFGKEDYSQQRNEPHILFGFRYLEKKKSSILKESPSSKNRTKFLSKLL